MNSKRKGSAGERELAHVLSEYGYECRRTQQYCGNTGDASDVVGLDYIHIECKRVENLNINKAMAQARRDAKNGFPAVFHRRNRDTWKVTMDLEDWMEIYNEYYSGRKLSEMEVKGLMDFGIRQRCENCKHGDCEYDSKRRPVGAYCNKMDVRINEKIFKNLMNCLNFDKKEGKNGNNN